MGFLDETGLSRFKGHIDALLGGKQDAGDYATKSYVDTADAKKATLASANTFTGNITAPSFIGSLSGNATSATKATQDGNGNVIATTYSKMPTNYGAARDRSASKPTYGLS